jgi:hypothetical protein
MAADNILSVSLPPVQWTDGTRSRDGDGETPRERATKPQKSMPKSAKASGAPGESPFEQAAPHEVDSFA